MVDPVAGLCADCQHCRIVKSERSTFYMCRLALTNPEYRKYPPVPVLRCRGYVVLSAAEGGAPREAQGPALSDVEGPDDKLTE